MKKEVNWKVSFSTKAKKQLKKLPLHIQDAAVALQVTLEDDGPIQKGWHHFSALDKKKRTYHCWLKGGKTAYVAVWILIDNKIQIIKITYVGTHEGAPY